MVSFPTIDGESVTLFENIDIDLVYSITMARSRGNLVSQLQYADPYWAGELRTVALSFTQYAEWNAFITECIDRQQAVDFIHPLHRNPSNYTYAATPGSGSGTVDLLPDGRTVRVDGLPSGLKLAKGDRFSLTQGNLVSHYKVAQAIASATTTDQEVKCTPRIIVGLFTVGATFVYKDPVIRLAIEPNSWSAALEGDKAYAQGTFRVYEFNREAS